MPAPADDPLVTVFYWVIVAIVPAVVVLALLVRVTVGRSTPRDVRRRTARARAIVAARRAARDHRQR